jgi:hypothetical protein
MMGWGSMFDGCKAPEAEQHQWPMRATRLSRDWTREVEMGKKQKQRDCSAQIYLVVRALERDGAR